MCLAIDGIADFFSLTVLAKAIAYFSFLLKLMVCFLMFSLNIDLVLWFLKNRPSRLILSISQNFRMSVCLFVCVFVRHTFSLRLMFFLPPFPEVQCLNFLDIQNPWGKIPHTGDKESLDRCG